jgi:hypothetical protein
VSSNGTENWGNPSALRQRWCGARRSLCHARVDGLPREVRILHRRAFTLELLSRRCRIDGIPAKHGIGEHGETQGLKARPLSSFIRESTMVPTHTGMDIHVLRGRACLSAWPVSHYPLSRLSHWRASLMKLLVLSGGRHPCQESTPILGAFLRAAGHEVTITEDAAVLAHAADLAGYDALVFNTCREHLGTTSTPPSIRTAISSTCA